MPNKGQLSNFVYQTCYTFKKNRTAFQDRYNCYLWKLTVVLQVVYLVEQDNIVMIHNTQFTDLDTDQAGEHLVGQYW